MSVGELQAYRYRGTRYFVDYRLQQFRSDTPGIRFYDFRSDRGDRILCKMIREGVADLGRVNL